MALINLVQVADNTCSEDPMGDNRNPNVQDRCVTNDILNIFSVAD